MTAADTQGGARVRACPGLISSAPSGQMQELVTKMIGPPQPGRPDRRNQTVITRQFLAAPVGAFIGFLSKTQADGLG